MVEDNVQLIRRILSGDEEAFSILMRKHQKNVHALVWRKIGDFHIAEEITQDTFIQVYKKLGTLEDPNRFSGWLYVIANRLCINWVKRNKVKIDKLNMQSLEDTSPKEIEESSYIRHMSDQSKIENYDLVKKLLQELPESERTVVTLYYLGEMTVKEIGKFLGVSVNTVKSRLRRGRKRLQEEASLVQETLGGVSLPTDLIENVMREISTLKPTVPPIKKPLLPWAALGTAAVLTVLLLGANSQFLWQFQQPYSFEAEAEPTVELIDDSVSIDIVARPDVRRQIGRSIRLDENSSIGLQSADNVMLAQALEDASTFNEPDSNSPPMFLPKPVPMLIAFRSLEKLNPDATRDDISAFAKKRFGAHPLADEWTELSLRLRRDGQGKIGELRRFAKLEIQILTDVSTEKHIEQIEAYQEALKQLDRLEKRFKSDKEPGDQIVLALPLRASEAPEPFFYRWKSEALKRLATFESLKVKDPDAARIELSEIVKIRFGAHNLVDEWIALYFRLSRDGKGQISDLKRLVELEIRILTDVGTEKHAEQIDRHRQTLKRYDELVIILKNENKNPETAIMDFYSRP